MADSKPLVSIGMPVYNGERHIRQALDSLLAQDYENSELIISDNASTDRTQEICMEYAGRDKRVRYYRNQTNMGIVWNFNRVFELSSGEYFMWAAHDDYWDPRYIRLCLEAFDISKDIVLAAAQFELIDPETEEVILTNNGFSTIGLSAVEKFRFIGSQNSNIAGIIYGIHRRSAVRKVMPLRKVPAPDILFLAELSFQGEFATVPEILMFERSGGISSDIKRYRAAAGNVSTPLFRSFPFFGRLVLTLKIAFRADRFRLMEKIGLACYFIGDYICFALVRAAAMIHRMLLVLWPSGALRARELWHRVRQRRKLPGGAGVQYRRQVDKASSDADIGDVGSHV